MINELSVNEVSARHFHSGRLRSEVTGQRSKASYIIQLDAFPTPSGDTYILVLRYALLQLLSTVVCLQLLLASVS